MTSANLPSKTNPSYTPNNNAGRSNFSVTSLLSPVESTGMLSSTGLSSNFQLPAFNSCSIRPETATKNDKKSSDPLPTLPSLNEVIKPILGISQSQDIDKSLFSNRPPLLYGQALVALSSSPTNTLFNPAQKSNIFPNSPGKRFEHDVPSLGPFPLINSSANFPDFIQRSTSSSATLQPILESTTALPDKKRKVVPSGVSTGIDVSHSVSINPDAKSAFSPIKRKEQSKGSESDKKTVAKNEDQNTVANLLIQNPNFPNGVTFFNDSSCENLLDVYNQFHKNDTTKLLPTDIDNQKSVIL